MKVMCQGFMTCDSAKFIGQNIHVNCGDNGNACPSNTANVCNKVTCEGKSIDVHCARPSCKPLLSKTCTKSKESSLQASFLASIVRNVNEAPQTASCPCEAENSWCDYGHGDCPRVNTCKGSLTPCDCNSCPTTGISCKGCDGPSPSPSPGPSPSPSPSPKCNSTSDCQSDEVCCLLY